MANCPSCGEEFDSERAMKAHHQSHDRPFWDVVIEDQYGTSPGVVVSTLHHDRKLPVGEVANEIGCTAPVVERIADDYGVELRDASEGKEVMWEKMDDDEQDQRVEAAHEKTRDLVDSGDHNFLDWAEDATEAEIRQRTKAAHEKTRQPPRLDVSVRGYERIRHGPHEIKHHRLLATLLVNDIEDLKKLDVHHEIPVWPDGRGEVAQAVNFLGNLELYQKGEHMRKHVESGDIPRDKVTGQFKLNTE
ncbi:hypothetical protein V9T20_12690 (plasmid) [Halobacterium salinarum]|uniref:hypothetical protein n=1 Tax=Halobacterium salinarum TaxID=2242 RepID=UPI0030CCDF22